MKKLMLLVAVVFYSCQEAAKIQEQVFSAKRIDVTWIDENKYENSEQFTVVTIDSCEYLLSNYDRSRSVTHKGNCKYCKTRNK